MVSANNIWMILESCGFDRLHVLFFFFFQGTLKDSLDRYSLYGLEDSADYDIGFKNEIEDQIKLVSTS